MKAGYRPVSRERLIRSFPLLAPHKRPREVRFIGALPRNEMGKVRKSALKGAGGKRDSHKA